LRRFEPIPAPAADSRDGPKEEYVLLYRRRRADRDSTVACRSPARRVRRLLEVALPRWREPPHQPRSKAGPDPDPLAFGGKP